jgi:hypothetical protein
MFVVALQTGVSKKGGTKHIPTCSHASKLGNMTFSTIRDNGLFYSINRPVFAQSIHGAAPYASKIHLLTSANIPKSDVL